MRVRPERCTGPDAGDVLSLVKRRGCLLGVEWVGWRKSQARGPAQRNKNLWGKGTLNCRTQEPDGTGQPPKRFCTVELSLSGAGPSLKVLAKTMNRSDSVQTLLEFEKQKLPVFIARACRYFTYKPRGINVPQGSISAIRGQGFRKNAVYIRRTLNARSRCFGFLVSRTYEWDGDS